MVLAFCIKWMYDWTGLMDLIYFFLILARSGGSGMLTYTLDREAGPLYEALYQGQPGGIFWRAD